MSSKLQGLLELKMASEITGSSQVTKHDKLTWRGRNGRDGDSDELDSGCHECIHRTGNSLDGVLVESRLSEGMGFGGKVQVTGNGKGRGMRWKLVLS